jgi:hypothetical protein
MRAPARTRIGSKSSPLLQAKGVSRRGAQAGIANARLLRTSGPRDGRKRNGDEHARSIFRINQRLVQASRRGGPVCIDCRQAARDLATSREHRDAENEARPKKASTDARLSDVGISRDQSSRRQKLAAVPEEIIEREVQGKTHMPTATGLIRAVGKQR